MHRQTAVFAATFETYNRFSYVAVFKRDLIPSCPLIFNVLPYARFHLPYSEVPRRRIRLARAASAVRSLTRAHTCVICVSLAGRNVCFST